MAAVRTDETVDRAEVLRLLATLPRGVYPLRELCDAMSGVLESDAGDLVTSAAADGYVRVVAVSCLDSDGEGYSNCLVRVDPVALAARGVRRRRDTPVINVRPLPTEVVVPARA
jgi:hypothetical protein